MVIAARSLAARRAAVRLCCTRSSEQRRSADVDVDAIPESVHVPDAGRRLRCSACGGKKISTRPAWRTARRAGVPDYRPRPQHDAPRLKSPAADRRRSRHRTPQADSTACRTPPNRILNAQHFRHRRFAATLANVTAPDCDIVGDPKHRRRSLPGSPGVTSRRKKTTKSLATQGLLSLPRARQI